MNSMVAKKNKELLISNFIEREKALHKLYYDLYSKTEYSKDGAAVKNFKYFKKWLEYPIADLGCGRGHIIKRGIIKKLYGHGYDIIGENGIFSDEHDQKKHREFFSPSTDITKPLNISKYKTAICIDVLEHITETKIGSVLANLAKCEKQVISVCTIPDTSTGGLLHITLKPLEWWDAIIGEYVDIVDFLDTEEWHRIYFTRRKK